MTDYYDMDDLSEDEEFEDEELNIFKEMTFLPKSDDADTLPPIGKFKRVAGAVKIQQRWTKGLRKKVSKESKQAFRVSHVGETLTFNVNAFKSHIRSCGSISTKAKNLFKKTPWLRTPVDLKVMCRVVETLKSFAKYSPTVRRELAKVVYYEKFDDGRIVVQQGHRGLSFYFILSGAVIVEVAEKDKTTGKVTKQIVGEMFAGDSFGELALLHDITRTATIICKGSAEFLRLDKPDFDMVLKTSHQQEWEARISHLRSLEQFKDFPPKELHKATATSKLVEYPDNTVVLRDTKEPAEFVYFIKSGQCQIVREMDLILRRLPFGETKFILPPLRGQATTGIPCNLGPHDSLKRFFLIVHVLEKGDYFGVGEDLTHSSVITDGKVDVILVSRAVLQKHDRGLRLEEMRAQLSEQFPTRVEVFRSFLDGYRWKRYKCEVIEDTFQRSRKPKNRTTFQDVPRVIRGENKHYYGIFNRYNFPAIAIAR